MSKQETIKPMTALDAVRASIAQWQHMEAFNVNKEDALDKMVALKEFVHLDLTEELVPALLHSCFICEYANQQRLKLSNPMAGNNYCDYCPVDWGDSPRDNYRCEDLDISPYGGYAEAEALRGESESIPDYPFLARPMVTLLKATEAKLMLKPTTPEE